MRRSKKSENDDDWGGGQYQELPCIPVKRAAVGSWMVVATEEQVWWGER